MNLEQEGIQRLSLLHRRFYKGKTGEILEINRKLNKVKVKSVNMIKKHLKPTKENKGGIISKENFIHLSNIKNIDTKKKEKKITGKK